MKITNENFFELNGKKSDDAANENKSEAKRTAAERLRDELISLFELDDRPDDKLDENESTDKQTAADEVDENKSEAKQTSADEVDENKSEAKQTAADETDENKSADEVDENKSAVKQIDDNANENKSSTKRTAAERLREKLMSLRKQDDGEIDHNAPALDVPVNNNEDTSKGETKDPDDGNVVDAQKAAPIVSPHEKPIDTAPSKDDVPQQAADDITARHVVLPEKSKEDYQDKDELPKLSTTNDGDASNANDTLPKLSTTNDGDEPNVNDTLPKLSTTNDGDASNTKDTLPKLSITNDGDASNAKDTLPKLSITNDGDESNAKDADERIQLKKPDDKNSKKSGSRKKILAVVSGVAFALVATTTAVGVSHMHSTTSQSRTAVPAKKTAASSSSSPVDGSSLDAVKEKLTADAKATNQPYKVQVTALGGGYTMGVITYYPNDATKTYMDYSVTAPKTPGAVTDDKKAQDINKKLSSSLPTINKTITVIDKSKVSMNTYKQSDGSYHTILLYDNKPFGFVTTKTDGSMVNNVTTYYIQTVQKKNK